MRNRKPNYHLKKVLLIIRMFSSLKAIQAVYRNRVLSKSVRSERKAVFGTCTMK